MFFFGHRDFVLNAGLDCRGPSLAGKGSGRYVPEIRNPAMDRLLSFRGFD